jgi:hypothetical protein
MADRQKPANIDLEAVQQRLLEKIYEELDKSPVNTVGGTHAASVLRLAEAWAWVTFPNQPHGGSAKVE